MKIRFIFSGFTEVQNVKIVPKWPPPLPPHLTVSNKRGMKYTHPSHIYTHDVQVMDLEARLEQAQQDLKSGVRPGKDRSGPGDRVLPRAPAKVSLSGHRNPVTCVALHPLYSVVASASEDATVKVRRLGVWLVQRCQLTLQSCLCI